MASCQAESTYYHTKLISCIFILVTGLFDWPMTKKNTITMDKVEDYISVPLWSSNIDNKGKILGKRYGVKCDVIGNILGNTWEM